MYRVIKSKAEASFLIASEDDTIVCQIHEHDFDMFEECEDMANHICNLLNQ